MIRHVLLALSLLAIMTQPVLAKKPLRFFFEKNIEVKTKPGEKHTVQEGEWLYSILRAKGYADTRIQEFLSAIQALNPHIPDINRLKPGQVLYIPNALPAATRKPPPLPPDSNGKEPYVIRSGETLIQVLQARSVPTKLIYDKYLTLFSKLNPDIPDINTLRAGQEVILPAFNSAEPPLVSPAPASPAGIPAQQSPDRTADAQNSSVSSHGSGSHSLSTPQTRTTPLSDPRAPIMDSPTPPIPPRIFSQPQAGLNSTTPTNATQSVDAQKTRTGLSLVRAVLEEMRFRFTPGDEGMFPLPQSGWLHVRLLETPLVELPWGGKVLLCPVPISTEWVAHASQLGIKVCTISPRWSLQEILEKLASSFPDRFRLWGSGRELVLTRDGIGMTLKSPQITITEHDGRKVIHMIWTRQSPDEPLLPQGLPEVLEPAQIKIIELDSFNELSRLPNRPRESIYVPMATHMELIRAINPKNPEELFGQTLPGNLNALLQLLREKNLLHQGMVQASWVGGTQNRIAVQVPAWTVSESENKIALLDRRFADPYLVSVLAHEGYTCFVLPN